jgi:hypothetical protein
MRSEVAVAGPIVHTIFARRVTAHRLASPTIPRRPVKSRDNSPRPHSADPTSTAAPCRRHPAVGAYVGWYRTCHSPPWIKEPDRPTPRHTIRPAMDRPSPGVAAHSAAGWRLYWPDRNTRWHLVEDLPDATSVGALREALNYPRRAVYG